MTIGFIGTRCPRCQGQVPLGQVHDCVIAVVPPPEKTIVVTKAA